MRLKQNGWALGTGLAAVGLPRREGWRPPPPHLQYGWRHCAQDSGRASLVHPPGSARLGFTPNSSRGHQPKAGDAQGWTCSLFLEADAFRKGSRWACLSVWGPTSPRSRASSAALPLEGHEKVLAVLSGSRTRQGDPASWPLRLPLLITPVATAGRVRRMKGAPPGAADRSY